MIGQLVSLSYDTGKDGSASPFRVVATIYANAEQLLRHPLESLPAPRSRSLADMRSLRPAHARKLYFSERRENPHDPNGRMSYFITVDDTVPRIFDMNFTNPT